MVRYGFFNAKKLINGVYDRKYNADDVNAYFKGAISRDGIYQFVGNQCRVYANTNMNVIVKDGKGQIDYHWFEITTNTSITINNAHATLNRYTAIIARYDETNRIIYLTTTDGEVAEKPLKPTPQRGETIREIVLAYVYVKAGVTEITKDDIIDTIEDSAVCGYVSTLLDTSNAGIHKVETLPNPSASNKGSIYYTEEFVQDGVKYPAGYYICEPTSYSYDFDELAFISDIYANRPDAGKAYLDLMFYASDTEKWYKCIQNEDGTYEWIEVNVNNVEDLPTASADTKGKYYVANGSLYIGTETGLDYKWKSLLDGTVSKSYVIEQCTATLTSAKTYSDTNLTTAKTYTDNNIPKLYNGSTSSKISNSKGVIIVNTTSAPSTTTCPLGYGYETYS